MVVVVVDIGGSGIKIGLYELKTQKITYLEKIECAIDDWDNLKKYHHKLEDKLIRYINNSISSQIIDCIGISTAGNVKQNGDIMRWGNKYNLIHKLNKLNYKTVAINDAEAHMYYCINKYPKDHFPAMCVIFGTGIGFAVADQNGSLVKTTDDHFSLDGVQLDDKNSCVHTSLGTKSFLKCIEQNDYRQYIKNVNRFLQLFGLFFLVKCVFIGGGNSWRRQFKQKILPQINKTNFNIVHIKGDSALEGVGYYVKILR